MEKIYRNGVNLEVASQLAIKKYTTKEKNIICNKILISLKINSYKKFVGRIIRRIFFLINKLLTK
jgi:hypothetical protein